MDTKWKKFSRSLIVRLILNGLVILCLLMEVMLCLQIYGMDKTADRYYRFGHPSADQLYGNTSLQEDIKNAWKEFLDSAIVNNYLLKDSEKSSEPNTKLPNITENIQYQLITKDKNGKEQNISNCAAKPDSLKEFPIYTLYKGYRNGDTYITDWTNYYVDSYTEEYEKDIFDQTSYNYVTDMDFYWLDINSIVNELCQGNSKYSQSVAKNIVDNIPLYKERVKDCLYYFYKNPSANNAKITKNLLNKLYGTKDSINAFKREIVKKYYNEYQKALTYDSSTGVIYSKRTDTYYYKNEQDKIVSCNKISKNLHDRFVEKMNIQNQLINEPLSDNEKTTLIETISRVIYIGDSGLDYDVQISIPVAAALGSPEEYSMYIAVDKELYEATQSVYMEEYSENRALLAHIKTLEKENIYILITVLIFLGFIILALLYVCGKKGGTEEIQYLTIDSWYTEIHVAFFVLGIIVSITCISLGIDTFHASNSFEEELLVFMTVLAVTVFILIQLLCSIVRKMKGHILIRQSILGKIFRVGQEKLYCEKSSKRIIIYYLVMCAVWLFFEFIAICFAFHEYDYWFLAFMQLILVFLLLAVAIFLRRYLYRWDQIRYGVKCVKSGNINYQIPTDDSKSVMNLFAKDINSLSEGLENAVDEMLKSEKLKTELISNVSHDIKTPLTSIITYVDLMKKEDVQPENVKEYIEVLDQKSQRLKALTDDLFEAAKATSGVMKVDAMRIDLGSLVNQAIGESSEKLEKSDLDVRNNIEREILYVMADGKLTWRIMENLLGNVSKYALAGSRVYIDAEDRENTILLTVKNISNAELNISADELMERFTRGDQSRNTEGSGLGLNIAQSLATLQGGNFHVEIDGDLFKAVLELPKAGTK